MSTGHSALVDLTLRVGEQSYPLAQLGPDYLIPRPPGLHLPAATAGTITVTVDGHARTLPVTLPQGATPSQTRVPIISAAQ